MLNAQELRHNQEKAKIAFEQHKRFPIIVVLDNIYDTFNIGSAFRVADSINASKIVITGKSSKCPPEKQIRKSSICISDYFSWEYYENIENYLCDQVKQKDTLISVEKTSKSKNYRTACEKIVKGLLKNSIIHIVVGNETTGVSPCVLNFSDYILEIPMHGVDFSMNVINALSIVGHEMSYQITNNLIINNPLMKDSFQESEYSSELNLA